MRNRICPLVCLAMVLWGGSAILWPQSRQAHDSSLNQRVVAIEESVGKSSDKLADLSDRIIRLETQMHDVVEGQGSLKNAQYAILVAIIISILQRVFEKKDKG